MSVEDEFVDEKLHSKNNLKSRLKVDKGRSTWSWLVDELLYNFVDEADVDEEPAKYVYMLIY